MFYSVADGMTAEEPDNQPKTRTISSSVQMLGEPGYPA